MEDAQAETDAAQIALPVKVITEKSAENASLELVFFNGFFRDAESDT